ncbi:MAG TPA: ParB N-terminal domain-containing protein [Clostridiales bacterium]|nr:ParB N-terminal domain-containing protein [Clostridiales bacterium]
MPVGKGSIVRATNASNQNAAVTEKTAKERAEREQPKILTDIPVAQITEVPVSWRKQDISKLALPELVKSIRKFGMLEPVIVRRLEDGQFQLLSGGSRLQAVKELGLETITARVFEGISDTQAKTIYRDLHRNDGAGKVKSEEKGGALEQKDPDDGRNKENIHELKFKIVTTLSRDMPDYLL